MDLEFDEKRFTLRRRIIELRQALPDIVLAIRDSTHPHDARWLEQMKADFEKELAELLLEESQLPPR